MRRRTRSPLFPYTTLFRSVDLRNPKRARDRLLVEVPQLTTAYGEQAALLAADWYDELRYLERVPGRYRARSEEHTSELQSRGHRVCRLLLEKKYNHFMLHI